MELKTGDWRQEKHVPAIEVKDLKFGEPVEIVVTVGKGVPHPNKPDHHIAWVDLYFIPKDGSPIQIGRAEFTSHGEENVLTLPRASFTAVLPGPGKLVALAFCNLHGLWKNELEVR